MPDEVSQPSHSPRRRTVPVALVALVLVLVAVGVAATKGSKGTSATSVNEVGETTPPGVALATTHDPSTTTTTEPPTTTTTALPPPDDLADPQEPGVLYNYPDVDMADPAIFWDSSARLYRLYTTNQIKHDPPAIVNVPMWTSPNMRDWTLVGDVMPTMPAWAIQGFTWAPEIHRFGNQWVLMPTVSDRATGDQCIAYAVAPTAEGPFVPDDSGPLVCQHDRQGSIDANVFVDKDRTPWLLYKSEDNIRRSGRPSHIWSQRLDGSGHPVGPVKDLTVADQPWQAGVVESPSMYLDAVGRYWLSVSSGPGDRDGYTIAMVTCDGPTGPCAPVTEDTRLMVANRQGEGPGEQTILVDKNGTVWLAYSPFPPFKRNGIRPFALAHLKWDALGRPYIAKPPASFWR